MQFVDKLLNKITMYRLMVYGLSVIAVISFLLTLSGTLPMSFRGMLVAFVVLIAACYLTNYALAAAWKIPANNESWLITALILFLILPQAETTSQAVLTAVAGAIAMASKFLITRNRTHLLNPAATAASILGLAGILHATWWVGSTVLWPFTLLFGLLVVRKIRRFPLLISFAVVSIFFTAALELHGSSGVVSVLKPALLSSPLIFLGTIMLTEPTTMPSRRIEQVLFAALVGGLYALHPQVGSFYMYPEVALIIGNVFAAVISPQIRARLQLKEIQKVSDRVYDYVFTPDRQLVYAAGQYMEWTLPSVKVDERGNRRTFTIASSPTEKEIHLGVKFSDPASSFKRSLRSLEPGAVIYAGQVAGDFTLPTDTKQKLCFIAGGIGITPFRSMLKYIADSDQSRDVVLLYFISNSQDAIYNDIFKQAIGSNIKVVTILSDKADRSSWQGPTGSLSPELIKEHLSDATDRLFYISGPPGMVDGYKAILTKAGVPRSRIRTDHFSGY